MSEAPASTRASLRLNVETLATTGAIRFLSDIVQLYLAEGLGLSPDAAEPVRIRLAVMEAVTNVVRHAYAGREPGPIGLAMGRDGHWLECVVSDRAERFDPFEGMNHGEVEMPRSEDLAAGGYGRGIIDSVMNSVTHHYDAGAGNELTMRVRLAD